MPSSTATSVGVGLSSHDAGPGNGSALARIDKGGALSPRRAVESIKDLLKSPQFTDGVRIFAIGAAVSASKMVFDALLTAAKRLLFGEATFRNRDEAYRWMLLLMMQQPSFKETPRSVEVSARPTLLANYEEDYRGETSEDALASTWSGVQANSSDKEGQCVSSNDAEEGKRLGAHFFPAAGESVHFVFDKTHFWASRRRELVGDTSWEEIITLSFLSTSSKPLRRIIHHAKTNFERVSRGRISVRRIGQYSGWMDSMGIAKRSVDSIYLPPHIKDTLLEDAKRFIRPETRRWYGDRGIPYRRGYLLHGKPGSGKSSMCHVLASELERPIYALSLAAPNLNDQSLTDLMCQVPSGAIVLIEDIDAAFGSRSDSEDSIVATSETSKGGKDSLRGKGVSNSSLSLSAVLNAIDGIGAAEGRLLCMTTNHAERLDDALVRPGRIDMSFEFGNATQEQARQLFLRWYAPHVKDSLASVDEEKAAEADAQFFSQQIPSDIVSVAAIQGFLLSCGANPDRAQREVGAWALDQQKRQ